MNANVEIIKYESSNSFLSDISYGGDIYKIINENFIFRGHKSASYELVPSLLRNELSVEKSGDNRVLLLSDEDIKDSELLLRVIEYNYISRFFRTCDENGLRLPNVDLIRKHLFSKTQKNMQSVIGKEWIPYELVEIFALAQHYGMETRLLDWSTSIDIAIYFAVHEDPVLTDSEKVNEDSQYIAIWALDYSIENIIQQLKVVRPPFYGNPNLAAQKGLFTYWDNRIIEIPSYGETTAKYIEQIKKNKIDRTPLDILLANELSRIGYSSAVMYKLMIPRRDKKELWNYLKKKKVSSASLFPGYAGVIRSFEEDNSFRRVVR